MIKRSLWAFPIAIVLAVAGYAPSARADAVDNFLVAVHNDGFDSLFSTNNDFVADGHLICQAIAGGKTPAQEAEIVFNASRLSSPGAAKEFVHDATTYLCPGVVQ